MHRFQKQESVLFKKLLRQPEGSEKKLALWLSALCWYFLVGMGIEMLQGLLGAAAAAMLTKGLFGGMRNLKVSLFISSSGKLGGFFPHSPFQ